jgi:hypothetical protein
VQHAAVIVHGHRRVQPPHYCTAKQIEGENRTALGYHNYTLQSSSPSPNQIVHPSKLPTFVSIDGSYFLYQKSRFLVIN